MRTSAFIIGFGVGLLGLVYGLPLGLLVAKLISKVRGK